MVQMAMSPTEAALQRPNPTRSGALTRACCVVVAVITVLAAPVAHAAEPTAETTPSDVDPTTTTPPTPITLPVPPPPTVPTTIPSTVPPSTAPPSTAPPTTAPSTTPAPAPLNVVAYPRQMANILATIRYVESRGDYTAPPNRGGASGAYQFITSTWDGYGGYDEAYLAPPEIQDERAAADVTRFLSQWSNDVSMIPVMWYYPRAARDVAVMDVVPVPSAGNVLTVREYQQRWLGVWAFLSGQPIPRTLTVGERAARLGFAPELAPPLAIDATTPAAERTATVAFPVLGPTRVAAPECGDAQNDAIAVAGLCAQEAPSIVFGVKLQPVLAVADGVITDVRNKLGGTIAITITDPTGRNYELAGFNDDTPGTNDGAAASHLRLTSLAVVGRSVRAGQVVGFMGDSSPLPLGVRSDLPTDATVELSTDQIAPHVRLTIVDLDGTVVDAYGPVIDALFRQACSVGIGPWSGVPSGGGFDPVTIETTDDNRKIDSEWVITDVGEVIASGWAAMIYPNEGCGWAPAEKRGPSAGGPTSVPVSWLAPIELSTSIWIDLALRDSSVPTAPIARR